MRPSALHLGGGLQHKECSKAIFNLARSDTDSPEVSVAQVSVAECMQGPRQAGRSVCTCSPG